MNKFRYLLAFVVMLLGFLPMAHTALRTSEYITLIDCICAMAGFLLAVHITETHITSKE
jgi:hypothetical protein